MTFSFNCSPACIFLSSGSVGDNSSKFLPKLKVCLPASVLSTFIVYVFVVIPSSDVTSILTALEPIFNCVDSNIPCCASWPFIFNVELRN